MSHKIILHIGTPKSGTTFIQTLLWGNRDALASAGVLLPGTRRGDHVTAANFARTARPNRRQVNTWIRLEEEIRQWPGTSILSNEWFSLASAEQAEAFIQRLDGAEVHVVSTVRNFAATVPAAWQEWLKLGLGSSFTEFYRAFQDENAGRWNWSSLDPSRFLPAWTKSIDPQHVHVVTVPPRSLGPNVLWERFALACGIVPSVCNTDAAMANESIGAASARFLAIMGPRLRDAVGVEADPSRQITWIRNYMSHTLLAPLKGKKIAIRSDFVHELETRSQQVADELARRGYRVHGDLDEFRTFSAKGGQVPKEVDDSEILALATDIIPEMLGKIRAESKRADEATAALRRAERGRNSAVPPSADAAQGRGERGATSQWATRGFAAASRIASRQLAQLKGGRQTQGRKDDSGQEYRPATVHDDDRPRRKTVHFTVNTLAIKRGGLVKAVRERANALAEYADLDVCIEVLSFQRTLDRDVRAMKRQGHLHQSVSVRSVIYSLDDNSNSKEDLRPRWSSPEIEGWTRDVATDKRTADFLYRGHLRYRAKMTAKGAVTQVDYFDQDSRLVRREYFDGGLRAIRRLHFDPVTNAQTAQEFIGRDGSAFLSIRADVGAPHGISVFVRNRQPQTFDSMSALYQHALERIVAVDWAPVICSEFRENPGHMLEGNLDDVVRAIRNPCAVKVAVAHSNHLLPPYVRGAGVAGPWKGLLNNLTDMDTLVVLTDAQREDLIAEYEVGDRIDVVPHAVYDVDVTPDNTDPNRIVLVSRTHPKKRMDEAIRTFNAISLRMPHAYLEIFGFGYGDAEAAKIEGLIAELALNDKVRFMPFSNDPGEIYGSAALTLLTSASEGFGLVLLESMSHGVPVIAYDANYGPRDVIDDGENGYLVPFGDHETLAERAVEVMFDGDLRREMGLKALETAGRFDRTTFVSRWSQILGRPPRQDRTSPNSQPEYETAIHSVREDGRDLVFEVVDTLPAGTTLFCRRPGWDDVVQDLTGRSWRLPRAVVESDATELYYRLPGDERIIPVPTLLSGPNRAEPSNPEVPPIQAGA